jgi:predicted SnoaL-like aldol condensation-catalyzing enzyme
LTIEENKRLVARFLDEVYNRGNLAVADELLADDYTSHNQLAIEVLGPEGIKVAAQAQRAAFPDQETIIDEMIAEGDLVVVRGRDRGTHSGAPFAGFEARGHRFEITWVDIFRVRDGVLREAWLEINVAELRRQLTGA